MAESTDQQQPDQNRDSTRQWAEAKPDRLVTPEENRAAERAARQVDPEDRQIEGQPDD